MSPLSCFRLAVLVVAFALGALPAAAEDADDKAVRDVVERFFKAYAAKDLDAYMALWSEKSPDYEARKKDTAGLFAATGLIELKSLAMVCVRPEGAAASVRVRVELAANDAKTGKPHPSFGALDRTLDLAREGGAWKVTRYGPSAARLMEHLLAADSKAARLRILDGDADLVGPEFVLKLLEEGDEQARRGRFDLASSFEEVAMEVAGGLGNQDSLAQCHYWRGRRLELQSRNESALVSFQKSLALFREANDRQGQGATLNSLGAVYDEMNRYAEALQNYQDGVRIARELGYRQGEAATLNNLGNVYLETGRFREAAHEYQRSLMIEYDLKDRAGEAKTLGNGGVVRLHMGLYGEALKQFKDCLKIDRELQDRREEAITLSHIGNLYHATGLYAEALRTHQDCLKIDRELQDRAGEAKTLINIGMVYDATGRYAEALGQFQDALNIMRELDVRACEAITLGNIGAVYEHTGRYEEALQKYRDAVTIQHDLGDLCGEAGSLQDVGGAYLHLARYPEAVQNLKEGLRIAEAIGDVQIAKGCYFILGKTYQAQKRWSQAADAYCHAADHAERMRTAARDPSLQASFLAKNSGTYFCLGECLLELGEIGKAFAACEAVKARGLVDILRRGKGDLGGSMSDDAIGQEKALQDRLTALGERLEDLRARKADADRQAALARDLSRARQALEDFRRGLYLHQRDLQRARPQYQSRLLEKLGDQSSSLENLGDSLFQSRSGLVVLSYLVGEKETLLFVLTAPEKSGGPARLTVHRIDAGEKDLADAVDTCRLACRDPGAAPISEALYRWLIAPAAGELAGAKQVVIVPDGVLHTLPFQVLRSEAEDPYLIERFPISYAPSVTALVKMEELGVARRRQYPGKPTTLLAVGLSDFRGREEESRPLPAAEPEACAVADKFGMAGRTLLDADATRAKVEAAWGACRYLHFATHGRFNSDAALYSSLVLHAGAGDEGVLYARDLLDADVPAELAVMSACETGLGERVSGEGLLGLSWSWFTAGVPSTVASQWLVGDGSTARLMTAFYGRLAAGDSKAEALRQAELTLLKDDATKHPFYWAPFVLVGDDR